MIHRMSVLLSTGLGVESQVNYINEIHPGEAMPDLQPLHLPDDLGKSDEFEDLVAALFAASGWHVTQNVRQPLRNPDADLEERGHCCGSLVDYDCVCAIRKEWNRLDGRVG